MSSVGISVGRTLPGVAPAGRAPRRQRATHRVPRALPDASQLAAAIADVSSTLAATATSPAVTAAAQRLSDVDPSTDVSPVVGGLAAGVSLVGGALYTAANGGGSASSASPARAMAILEKDPDAQLLDIRPRGDFSGSPDLSSAKKSALACPYKPPSTPEGDKNSTVSLGWAERVGRMGKIKDKSTIVILDSDGTTAPQAAKALAKAAPKRKLVTVAGGAEAWREELAWKNPLGFSLPGFGPRPAAKEAPAARAPEPRPPAPAPVAQSVDRAAASARRGAQEVEDATAEASDSTKGALLLAAALGGGVLLFVEIEQILELIGVIFIGQFLLRRVLFAEERERTVAQARSFVNDKIAAQDAGRDLRRLADAVLDVDAVGSVDEVASGAADDARRLARAVAPGTGEGAGRPARDWIDEWRESDDEGGAAAPVPARSAEAESARRWIEKWRASGRARMLINA